MEVITMGYQKLTAAAALLASLTVLAGCGSTGKSLLGKRHSPTTANTTETASLSDGTTHQPSRQIAEQPRQDPAPVEQEPETVHLTDRTPSSNPNQLRPTPSSTPNERTVVRADFRDQSSRDKVAFASATSRADGPVVRASALQPFDAGPSNAFQASAGTVQHVGTQDFDHRVLDSPVPVLVDFYADWCGPCRKLAPTLDSIASEHAGARVVKVNIEDSPQLARRYKVRTLPTVMVFKNGDVVARNTGLAGKNELLQMLAR
jgi:thioredoxin 1